MTVAVQLQLDVTSDESCRNAVGQVIKVRCGSGSSSDSRVTPAGAAAAALVTAALFACQVQPNTELSTREATYIEDMAVKLYIYTAYLSRLSLLLQAYTSICCRTHGLRSVAESK
jgi:hypothetical protein